MASWNPRTWLSSIALKAMESLPLPSRFATSGLYANWIHQLGIVAAIQPISPADANNGRDNSIVAICINWIATSWQVAKPQVGTLDGKSGEFKALDTHDLITLLASPSPDTDGGTLLWALITDYVRLGNAFASLVKTNSGKIARIEYLPARYVKAVGDDKTGRLSHYLYQPNGAAFEIQPADILHIRHGIDEDFPLLGVSPLAAQFREIVTDNAYSDCAGGFAINGGMPQVVFTPRASGDGTVTMSREQAETLSEKLNEKFRKNPGQARILPGSLDMHRTGANPAEMALTEVRAMPETRIPAALGLPALLLQLLTGIQKSTFSNFDTATKQGWRGCLIPMQNIFASAITRQVLAQMDRGAKLSFRWDTCDVPELQSDEMAERAADREDVKAGILTADEARERQGLAALPAEVAGGGTSADDLSKLMAAVGTLIRGGFEPMASLEAVGLPPVAHTGLLPVTVQSPEAAAAIPLGSVAAKSLSRALSLRPVIKRDAGISPSADLYEAADAFRRALAKDEQAAIDALATDWTRARKAIEAALSETFAKLEAGADVEDLAAAYERNLAEVDGILADLADRGAAVVEDAQKSAVGTTAGVLEPLARAAAGTAPSGFSLTWQALDSEAFSALAGFASDGSPLSELLATFGRESGDAIRQGLLDGIALGENPRRVAARLSASLGTSRARLENIARTEMLRASREASRRTYQANRDVLNGWVRLSAADSRTCVACWALHGTKSDVHEIMPSHCQCRCTMVPDVKSWAELLNDPTLPDTRTPITGGEELFSAMDEDTQKSVLGPSRFDLYQSGTPLKDLSAVEYDPTWGPTTRVKPLAEVGN